MTQTFLGAMSTHVFRGVSDTDCQRQAEVDAADGRRLGYEPQSQTWADDAGLRVLTVSYLRAHGSLQSGPWPASNPSNAGGLPIGWIIIAIVGLAVAYGAFGTPKPQGAATPNPAAPIAAWWPPGFTVWSADSSVAYQWLTQGTFACTYSSGICWGMTIVTRDGCPTSLYAEVSLADASGTAIGYTNDVAGAVSAGQRAQIIFDTFETTARTARISKISCY